MASNKEKLREEAPEALYEEIPAEIEAPIPEPVKAESIYTADELADNYKLFNTSREIVIVALRLAGVKNATFQEAKNIIELFKNKEVK